jgi:hypothetical protein
MWANIVNFQYIRKENQYVQNVGYPASSTVNVNVPALGFSCTSANNNPNSYSAQIITPCYLSQITSSSFKVDFGISVSNELKYTYNQGQQGPFYNSKFRYNDLEIVDIVNPTSAYINSISKWYKLDNINISDYKNQVKEKYGFEYNNVPDDRLFLQKFKKMSVDGTITDIPTSFSYNSTPLPPYNSLKVDKWGFYNGKPYPDLPEQYTISQLLAYFDMDNNYAQAGTLTGITYPTGGSTQFLYEPNDYSSVIQKNGNAINLANQAGTGGGIRINKIIDNDNNGNQYWKIYKYTNGATNASSGILAGDRKLKLDIQIANPPLANGSLLDYTEASTFNFTDGKEVVYSEVKEELKDGSYTVFKYANSDNSSYRDEIPVNIYSDAWAARYIYPQQSITYASSYTYPKLSHSSRELERGTLLSKEIHNAAGQLLYKADNIYNNDPARYNQYIRTYDNYAVKMDCSTTGSVNENYYQAVKLYTYFPYLQKQTEYSYDETGTQLLKTETNYSYDPVTYQLIKKTTKSSNGNVVDNYIKYPRDFAGIPVYDAMTANNMLNSVVETSGYTNNVLAEKNIINYQYWNGNTIIAPYNVQTQQKNNPPETRFLFNAYDGKGKILEQQKASDSKSSILYDYSAAYKVADIMNAAKGDFGYNSFEGEEQGNVWFSSIGITDDNTAPMGKKCLLLNSTIVNYFGLLPSKKYVVSYWYKAGSSVSVSSGTQTNIITRAAVNNWIYTERVITGTTQLDVSGTGYIDELRIFPVGALMTTYAYNPLVGITSQCDVNNYITYYEYDALNRLKIIRNQDRNIIKQFDYKYQTAISNTIAQWVITGNTQCQKCTANPAYNTGVGLREEKDQNPLSSTYNQLRWVVDNTIYCPAQVWQNTATAPRCVIGNFGNPPIHANTGEIEQEQVDINPCSITYNQTQWVSGGFNTTLCPPPVCSTANCTGEGWKCINNNCEKGRKIFVSSSFSRPLQMYVCIYYYSWSDGSVSSNYTVTQVNPCF